MSRKKLAILGAAGAVVVAGAVSTAAVAATASPGLAVSNVPTANTKSDGFAPASRLSAELTQIAVAQGSTKLENTSALTSYYGYDNDVVNSAGQPQMLPTPATATEAHKTEPDKNTYLVFRKGLPGADPNYDYGSHFLFQGHEGGAGGAGYITRINLDADAAHRVTLLATPTRTATRSPRSTAPPGTHGRSGCCSPPRTRTRRPTPPRPATRRR